MRGVLRYKLEVYCQFFADKLYGLGVPKQFPWWVFSKWCLSLSDSGTSAERSWNELFFLSFEFSYEKFLVHFLGPLFCGSKKPTKFPANVPQEFPKNNQEKFSEGLLYAHRESVFQINDLGLGRKCSPSDGQREPKNTTVSSILVPCALPDPKQPLSAVLWNTPLRKHRFLQQCSLETAPWKRAENVKSSHRGTSWALSTSMFGMAGCDSGKSNGGFSEGGFLQ